MPNDDSTSPQIEYRDLVEFPGYRIGSDGSIWTRIKTSGRGSGMGRGITSFLADEWRQLKGQTRKDGYKMFAFRTDGKVSQRFIHRMVLETFVGPCPTGMECRHFNGNRSDNRISNLCWGTKGENGWDRIDHGTTCKGSNHPISKLKETDIPSILEKRKNGMSVRSIANLFGVSESLIRVVLSGQAWRHVPR